MKIGYWSYVDELKTVPSMVKMLEAIDVDVVHTNHVNHDFPVLIVIRPGIALFLELFATKGYKGYRKYCEYDGHGMFDIFPELEHYLEHNHNVHIVIDYSYEYMYFRKDIEEYFNDCRWGDNIHLFLGSAEVETTAINSYFVPSWCMTEVETVSYVEQELEDKTFLCLNRQPRAHRALLVAMLHKHGAINDGHISFLHKPFYLDLNDFYAQYSVGWFLKHCIGEEHSDEVLYRLWDAFQGEDQILDDYKYDDPHYSPCFYTNIYEQYKHSMISVISEASSDMEFEGLRFPYISEKTFKAIAYGHPFILNTVHDTLKVAKQLGFKTFAPYINELYDLEPDTYKRANLIAEEVKRLTTVDKEEFRKKVAPIVEHNQSHFRDKRAILMNSGFKKFHAMLLNSF